MDDYTKLKANVAADVVVAWLREQHEGHMDGPRGSQPFERSRDLGHYVVQRILDNAPGCGCVSSSTCSLCGS